MKTKYFLAAAALLSGIGVSQAQLNNIHNFTYEAYPVSSMINVNNVLYGMTEEGGANYDGNIFSINLDGSNYKDLYDFADSGSKPYKCSGDEPYGSLTLVGNTLFGTTAYGGYAGDGTVFSIHLDGTNYRDLYDFADSGSVALHYSGYDPYGSLTAVGHTLYSTTYYGGAYNAGTLFSVDTSFTKDTAGKGYRDLWDFNYNHDSNGAYPYTLKLAVSLSGKVLYGMGYEGGRNNDGNIFSIDTNGKNYKDLYDFQCCGDGEYPYSSVVLSGAKLFGMTEEGGEYGDGSVFSIDTNGSDYKPLYDFGYSNGGYPEGDLTIAGNMLYGMTEDGGLNGDGNIFTMDTLGNQFQDMFDFDYYNYGGDPEGSLTLVNGNIYGMTYEGGPLDGGTIFKMGVCGTNPTMVTDSTTADNGSNTGTATANASQGATPYNYLWAPGGQTTATATGLAAGTYTVTVTSANGCEATSLITVESTLGVNNITVANGQVSVYPNPNGGDFTLALSGATNKATIEVFNMLGEQVYTGSLISGNNSINMNTRANGVYFYKVISDNGNLVGQGKLEVQK